MAFVQYFCSTGKFPFIVGFRRNFLYILYFNFKSYYVAGDTDLIKDNIAMLNDIDFAFVPIGGTYTMNALEASKFVNLFKPKEVIPIHYGMVVGNEADLNNFVSHVDSDIKVNILL